jgi:hypothetical protein
VYKQPSSRPFFLNIFSILVFEYEDALNQLVRIIRSIDLSVGADSRSSCVRAIIHLSTLLSRMARRLLATVTEYSQSIFDLMI